MKNLIKILSLLIVMSAVTFIACNKDKLEKDTTEPISEYEQLKNNFFDFNYAFENNPNTIKQANGSNNLRTTTNNFVTEINTYLQSVEDDDPFVQNFVNQFGYLYWTNAKVCNDCTNDALVIPVSPLNQAEETSIFTAIKDENNDIKYSVMKKSDMVNNFKENDISENFWNAFIYSVASTEKELFGDYSQAIKNIKTYSENELITYQLASCYVVYINTALWVSENMQNDVLFTIGGSNCLSSHLNYDDWLDQILFNPNDIPAVVTKLNDLNDAFPSFWPEYWIQTLDNAADNLIPPSILSDLYDSFILVNLDFFGVKITQMPILPGYSIEATPEELLEYLRFNFSSDFILGFENDCYNNYTIPITGGEFVPINFSEQSLWESINPLTATFSINMQDDGNVMCTDYSEGCCWNFSTLNAPGWFDDSTLPGNPAYDGFHPVSGNRKFELRDNLDGTYTFYTLGVDRLTGFWHIIGNQIEDGFEQADDLWTCMLDQVAEIIILNGGSVDNNYEIETIRPNWEDVLNFVYTDCGSSNLNNFNQFPCGE